jgi:hypothetical protein
MIPLSGQYTQEEMAVAAFNCTPSPFKLESDGFTSTTVFNVPAERDEPFAPAQARVAPWALLYYRDHNVKDPDKYWVEEGRKVFQEFKQLLKSSNELKSAASQAVAGAKDDDEKLTRLVMAVRKDVRSINDPEVTTADREKLVARLQKEGERNAAEIFRSGIAFPAEMNVVLGAMAADAGIDARPALVADRNEAAFAPHRMTDRYFLGRSALAVKRGDSWKLFDVSDRFLTPGMLPYAEEGMYALITDSKTPSFIEAPPAPPEASVESRTARLALAADGTLEGDVEESYTGHRAEEYRETLDHKSPAQREEWLRNRIVGMFPDAQVTGIKLENIDDAAQPFGARYHLNAPHYAQVTGKRILFEPSAFRRSQGSPFTAAERTYDVEFPYAWKEADEIRIKPPDGFALDNADAPSSMSFGKTGGYKIAISVAGQDPELVTLREFILGNGAQLNFPLTSYAALRQIFGEVRKRDEHTISLIAK